MTSDQLSKRADRELHNALASVVLTQFPNPDRNNCPDISVLKAIANKRISMRDPALQHAGTCSPCFEQLTGLRNHIRQTKLLWSAGAAAAAILLAAVIISCFGLQRYQSPTLVPERIAATLDLRNVSQTRDVQSLESTKPIITIPKGRLLLTIYLPVGSDEGNYDLQIRKSNQAVAITTKGQAMIENGITKVTVDIETLQLARGEYDFAWRVSNSEWSSARVLIQ